MKIRWSKPFDKKFYSGDKIIPTDSLNKSFFNKDKLDLRNVANSNKNNSNLINNDNFATKRLLGDRLIENDKDQHFINLKNYVFYFKNSEIFIFGFIENINKGYNNDVDKSIDKENYLNYLKNPIEKDEFSLFDFVLHDIKKINFLAYDENIIYCTLNKDNNHILLSSDFGIIHIININLIDFFIEIVFSFNIKQNYLYSYEILSFCENNNILLTLDNNLYICEIYKKKKSQPTQVFKNCLFKCEYLDEKILCAEKFDNLVSVYTNKAIYLVDFYDMSSSLFYKKDTINNYAGRMRDDNIYFIKDENTYAVYSITDRDKKLSFKLSSKNQLNILNFSKIIYVDNVIMVIVNEKSTEVYLISLLTFKIINRESILFENPNFIVYNMDNQEKSLSSWDIDRMVTIFSLNEINFDIKYKIGYIKSNRVESVNNKISNSILTNENTKALEKQENLFKISAEENHLKDSARICTLPKNDLEFNIISNSLESLLINDKLKKKDENTEEVYELKEFETNYIEENQLQEFIFNRIKKIKSYISYLLRITKHEVYFKTFKVKLSDIMFEKAVPQIRLLINLFIYTSSLLSNYKKHKSFHYILSIENETKINWIANFGSYSLRVSKKISSKIFIRTMTKKLEEILGLCLKINDLETFKQIYMKFKLQIKLSLKVI